MHTATISLDIRQSMRAWGAVGKAFQDAAPQCETCAFCRVTGDPAAADSECTLGRGATDMPEHCAAYRYRVQRNVDIAIARGFELAKVLQVRLPGAAR